MLNNLQHSIINMHIVNFIKSFKISIAEQLGSFLYQNIIKQ